MWAKISERLKTPKAFYLKPNKSEAAIAAERYNDLHGYDFSDGPIIPSRAASLKRPNVPRCLPANLEALALESLVMPRMPATYPTIVIQPPTPPWASLPGSQQNSEPSSDDERSPRTHQKSSSDTLLQAKAARIDAARRQQEAAAAFEAIGRAVINLQKQTQSNFRGPTINFSYPLDRQPKRSF